MAAMIIDGKRLAERIRADTRQQVKIMASEGHRPKLAAIIVGEPAAGMVYARSQARQCADMGIEYELVQTPSTCGTGCICEQIDRLNRDDSVTGIMLHLPLPPQIDAPSVQYRIDPYKDVEGVNPANIGMVFYGRPIIAPCTALAVVELIKETGMQLRGANAVVVGQGAIVGLPISVFLLQQFATVTGCHVATRDLAAHTRQADLLVVAVGKAGLIGAEHVKPGAVVIDVGINRVQTIGGDGKAVSKTVGDVDCDAVCRVASAVTPVPGGVGPVTVAMLLRNTVEATRKQLARRRGTNPQSTTGQSSCAASLNL
ncbi:MAG: bifunctional 5,10-methylenetetrahydrofolate dehydrogenase/5,10-methenyltetrahydrofolate cyclohydrolase [Phycisphaerae bacterium]|nr:bifunctional 5,10-methylenetetrahydrofolate dehydrogenase/5,10-methenyltetrahydrofolate cyclohydrolase [Phycisphaerae bacterium]